MRVFTIITINFERISSNFLVRKFLQNMNAKFTNFIKFAYIFTVFTVFSSFSFFSSFFPRSRGVAQKPPRLRYCFAPNPNAATSLLPNNICKSQLSSLCLECIKHMRSKISFIFLEKTLSVMQQLCFIYQYCTFSFTKTPFAGGQY